VLSASTVTNQIMSPLPVDCGVLKSTTRAWGENPEALNHCSNALLTLSPSIESVGSVIRTSSVSQILRIFGF